jgi:hypothetical protein
MRGRANAVQYRNMDRLMMTGHDSLPRGCPSSNWSVGKQRNDLMTFGQSFRLVMLLQSPTRWILLELQSN